MKILLFQLLIFAIYCPSSAQVSTTKFADSLRNKPYSYLQQQVERNGRDTLKARVYLNAWVQKAKLQKDREQTCVAYQTMLSFVPDSQKHQYADSLIHTAKLSRNGVLIGESYIIKGALYNREHQFGKALDNYLLSARYTDSTSNLGIKYANKLSIAVVKYQLGFYEESLALSKECNAFFSKEGNKGDSSAYLVSLYNTSIAYTRLGKYDLSSQFCKRGAAIAAGLQYADFKHYFDYCEAQNLYYKKNYHAALSLLTKVQTDPYLQYDKVKLAISNLYIGRCFWHLGEREKALPYFKKADDWVTATHAIRLDIMPVFEYLVTYYKDQDDDKNQLKYIRRMMQADSIIHADFKYLSVRIHKEYDTAALQTTSLQLEEQLRSSDRHVKLLWFAVISLALAAIYFAFQYFHKKKVNMQRFENIINPDSVVSEPVVHLVKDQKPEISQEVVNSILMQLEQFEKRKGFLTSDLTLVNLAASFNTNANYLSKVINYYKGKPYSTYLNELRINYCVQLLKDYPKFRKYSIKALGEECGFKTAQHFSKAFYASTGLYPSFFLAELSKQQESFLDATA